MARKVIHPAKPQEPVKKKTERARTFAPGARVFEVVLYNKKVRNAVEQGERHSQYDDDWAENRYVEVEAESPEIARRKIATRYPKHHGFVIVDVIDTDSKFDEDT